MSSHYLAYLNLNSISNELYYSIIGGSYSSAVKLTRNLAIKNSSIISDVVSKLAEESNPNLLSYGYKLWFSGEKDIVKQYLPKSFALIFKEEDVILVNGLYNLALKLDVHKDYDGDRKAWGDSSDKTSRRVIWKVIPIWENNRVHFILKNTDCNQFLKMGLFPDDLNDRPVYGTNSHDEMRHTWYLDPIFYNEKYCFYIRNRQFSQRLKLAVSVDYYRDRLLWGHNGEIQENDDLGRFVWEIKSHSGGYDNDEL